MGSNINLCISCGVRPKYVDGTKTHDFCGRSCANRATKSSNFASPTAAGKCDFCHWWPKRVQGARTFDYCSKTCAKNSQAQTNTPGKAILNGAPPGAICKISGCTQAAQNLSGSTDYCSPSHQTLAHNVCLLCRKRPKQSFSIYCGHTCVSRAEAQSPCLLEVPKDHNTFADIAGQFNKSWRHSGTCPPVQAIYKIVNTEASMQVYEAYRAGVEKRGNFKTTAGRSAGNQCRRWHGTTRECNIGDVGHDSYKLQAFGKKTGWGRFGSGIYTSSTSSKSNDYSSNKAASTWKAIMLNKVVVGRGYKIKQDNSSLISPPAGYDSVLGEIGGSLNHDELIVYTNDAIRTSWLVMYAP